MQLIETALGRFGSRFTLHFLTHQRQVRLSPLGKYYDRTFNLTLGYKVGEQMRVLPFTNQPDRAVFPEVEMELTMTSLTFRARDRQLGLAAKFSFVAPFYPKDEQLCTAPFFYVTAELENAPGGQPVELLASLALADQTAEVSGPGLPPLTVQYRQLTDHWGPHPGPDRLSDQTFAAPLWLTALETSSPQRTELLLATWLREPVLEVNGAFHSFLYTDFYEDIEDVCRYAAVNSASIRQRAALFDSLLGDSSLDKASQDFIAFTFQSYIINTWLTYPQETITASSWFSVWEGNCTFHSTVDVEYNLAWFYLLLWPELLEKTLLEWQNYLQSDERGSWLSHDIGGLLGANGQVYPHQMEVEENCNFILLTYALWRTEGRDEIVANNARTVESLIRFVLDSDTTGNGFPNRGIANTVDDASPAVQFGKEQIYLAVKALAACWAAALLLERAGHPLIAEECRARVALITRTLDETAWQGDHYAVTLDRTTEGLVNPWTGQPLPPGPLTGWDAYTLYTGNGLLYLLATTPVAELPDLDYARFRQDLEAATAHSLIEYGCTHSSTDRSHIWVSQNLWRDHLAGYFGLDYSPMTSRYWAFQQFENGREGRGGCFVDTYGGNHLRYYPRGITSLGSLASLAGMRLDRINHRLSFRPVRVPLRVPILPLADWTNGRLPWAEFSLADGQVRLKLENADLIEAAGLSVELLPPDFV